MLQNGAEHDERVRAVLDGSTLVAAVGYAATAMAWPAHVQHHGPGDLVMAPSPRSDVVARQFAAAGIPTQISVTERGIAAAIPDQHSSAA